MYINIFIDNILFYYNIDYICNKKIMILSFGHNLDKIEYSINFTKKFNNFLKYTIFTSNNTKDSVLYIIQPIHKTHIKSIFINLTQCNDFNGGSLFKMLVCTSKINYIYFGSFKCDWYQSIIYNNINSIEYIKKYIKNYIKYHNVKSSDLLFFGESMGGYASIYLSIFFNNCKCIALSPQLINFNNSIIFDDFGNNIKIRNGITKFKSISSLLNEKKDTCTTQIFIINCRYEDNKIISMNTLQTGTILNFPNTYVGILNCDKHSIIFCYKTYLLYEYVEQLLINKNYINNPKNILKNIINSLVKVKR